MKERDDDIFNHIRQVLRNHEEPYEEGAWERFKAYSHTAAPSPLPKHPIIPLWKWATAAAAVITGVFLFSRIFHVSQEGINIKSSELPIVQQLPTTDTPSQQFQTDTETVFSDRSGLSAQANTSQPTPAAQSSVPATTTHTVAIPQVQAPQEVPLVAQTQVPETVPSQAPTQPKTERQPDQNNHVVDFWKNRIVTDKPEEKRVLPQQDNRNALLATTSEKRHSEKNRKWQPSLYVSPVFSDLGVDMGYGVSLAYAINDKLKISSGIAHAKISTSRSFDESIPGVATAPEMEVISTEHSDLMTYASQPSSVLQQVTGSLSGIDIPVELNYSFNKKFYAAAGVSGLVVLHDKKTYTYEDYRNIKVSVETSKGALKEDKMITVQEYNTTSAPAQAPAENIPFLGYYNISVGYRQKLSNKNAVSIEPFLKVPMKKVTQQNLNYQGTGIRLRFDF